MAQNIKVLWIVVAIFAAHTAAVDNNTITAITAVTTTPENATTPANTTTPSATEDPANTTTPVNTTTSSTTGASGNTTTPVNTTTSSATEAPANTTIPVNTTTPATTAVPATTAAPDPCSSNPCGQGSTCEARANQGFVCLCLAGDNYNNNTHRCDPAKVFPGLLNLPGITYENTMSDKTSQKFKETADNITQALDNSLGANPTYIRSIVLELKSAVNSQLRALTGVNASVEIIYSAESDITATGVVDQVKKATECTDCALKGATFAEEDLCVRNPCDVNSTSCSSANGTFSCTCLNGYVPSEFCTRVCRAIPGPTTAAPVTVCPSGQELVESTCKDCQFGYTGFNCNENWKLILVIVGSVLGGLLLISLILLIVVASMKSSKKNKQSIAGIPYISQSSAKELPANGFTVNSQTPSFNGSAAFANAGVPRFPRATSNNSWDNRANMFPSNSQQNLVDRNLRPNDNEYDINPYAESRLQNNPNGRSQGHTNPYYN